MLSTILFAMVLAAAPAPAASPGADPSPAEMLKKYYPERAQRMEIEGRVELVCAPLPDGRLHACEVAAESPPGLGFGDAALRMTPAFRMKPLPEGASPPVGATVRIPIAFSLPGGAGRPTPPLSLDEAVACYGLFAGRMFRPKLDEETKRAGALAERLATEASVTADDLKARLARAKATRGGASYRRCLAGLEIEAARTGIPPLR